MTRHRMPENFLPLCLWSGPRNVSTALMYSFAQRSDTRVVDEPLYGHYLTVSGAQHPGRDDVLADMDCDGDRVMSTLLDNGDAGGVLFMKQMAHHLVDLDLGFLDRCINILLVRDPEQMLPSLTIQLPDAGLRDTGLALQCKLLDRFMAGGATPIVLDSRELLLDPGIVLNALCDELDISFEPAMLSWEAGARPEDGIWARHWYQQVHKSTGFSAYTPKTDPFPDRLRDLLDECRPYYQKLYSYALKAKPDQGRGK